MMPLHKILVPDKDTHSPETQIRCMYCHAELQYTEYELENYYIQYDIRCKYCDRINNYEERRL